MVAKLVRDKKTKVLINTNTDDLKNLLAKRATEKRITNLETEVKQLREDIAYLLESRECHVA